MEVLIVIGWVLFGIWCLLNLVCLFVFADHPSQIQIHRELSVGDILAFVFLIPIPVIFWNIVITSPMTCMKDTLFEILEYQPFKKKK